MPIGIHELEQAPEDAIKALADKQAVQNELLLKPIEITLLIPSQAYFLSGIRDFTLSLTQNLTGFSKKWAFRFQAVVDELCNNAIEHGSRPGENIKITFISVKNESLEVIVEDTGTGKDKVTAALLKQLLEERKKILAGGYMGFRGRGLPKIVSEWSDEIHFEDVEKGGIRVRIKKYLREGEDIVSSNKSDPTHLILQ